MSIKKRILLIEKDKYLRNELLEHFSATGEFEVFLPEHIPNSKLNINHYDIVLIDTQSLIDFEPIQNKLQLNAKNLTPFIILSDTDNQVNSNISRVTLKYLIIKKPFRFVALLAKVRTEISVFKRNTTTTYRIGPYDFFPHLGLLKPSESAERKELQTIKLTEKESSILIYLLKSEASSCSRVELLDFIWGYKDGITTHTLETHIYRLREKLKSEASEFISILTVKDGYSLVLQKDNK